MKNQRRVASNDDQLSEFLFGSVRPWWDRRPWLRRLFLVPLRSVDKSYGRWSKASFTQTIPKDPGAPRPRISTGQVLPFKSHRQGQRVQRPSRLFQTPCTAASLTYQVFWQRRAAQSGLSRRRQRNRQELPHYGLAARDALRGLSERSPRDSCDPEGV